LSDCHTRKEKEFNAKQVRTLLIDNYDNYTYNIFQFLAVVNGVAPIVVKNDRHHISYGEHSFDNIVISPGPGSPTCAADIGICMRMLYECKDISILGICLDHQTLGYAKGAYIRQIAWLPGSQVQLMVVTNKFVKIYDLSQDNISPMQYFTLLEDSIIDAVLVPILRGWLVLIVLSQHGMLYRQQIGVEGYTGAQVLTETIHVQGREVQSKGISLCFTAAYRLLFLSYHDGSTLIGQLNPEGTCISEVSSVLEGDQDGQLRPAGLHHWKELLDGSGFLSACLV